MWVAGGLMIGYGVAETWPWLIRENLAALGILVVVAFLGAGVCRSKTLSKRVEKQDLPLDKNERIEGRAKIYFFLGMIVLAGIYYNFREGRPVIAPEMRAPREAELTVEVTQEFALKEDNDRVAGLGIIRVVQQPTPCPPPAQAREGDKTWGSTPNPAAAQSRGKNSLIGQKINFSADWNFDTPLEVGSWIKIKGVLAPNNIPNANKNANKNYRADKKFNKDDGFDDYLNRMHIAWSISRGEVIDIVREPSPFMHAVARIHDGAIKILGRRWSKTKENGLLSAMVIGSKAELTPQQLKNLSRSSTTHLIVADGLNVAAVAAVLWVVVKLTGASRLMQAILVVVGLGAYSLIVGAAPSVLRAWGMVTIVLFAWAAYRQMNIWAALVLAATISLIVEPVSFLHAGWRLSFSVVGGIVLGMSAVERWGGLQKLRGPIGWIARTSAVSLAASLAVAPLTAAYWGISQPLGFIVNAVTITLGELVKILGTASCLLGWLPWVSKTINEAAYLFLGWIEWAIENYLKIPGAVVDVPAAKFIGVEVWGTLTILGIFYILARWWRPGCARNKRT
jgi:ComEC/Rec2-related protein